MKKVINTDNWNANLYDNKHAFVSHYGETMIELLAPKQGEYILDVGCGTGDLTKGIHDLGAIVTGIDNSQNMINQACDKYPELSFKVEDATKLKHINEFDAVFSNAALHWITSPKKVLNCIYQSLKRNGRFVAEFGGKDNVQLITEEIRKQLEDLNLSFFEERFPWYFPSIGEYTTLMENIGFNVTFAQHFDRPTPLDGVNGLRNWMEMFGKSMFAGLDSETVDRIMTNIEHNLKETMFKEDKWIADYKRIRVVGVK